MSDEFDDRVEENFPLFRLFTRPDPAIGRC